MTILSRCVARRYACAFVAFLITAVLPTPAFALDCFVNFGLVTVSTGYNASATTIVLSTGDGATLPQGCAFNAVWFDAGRGSAMNDTGREVVRVTVVAGDTLTITRAQESTTAVAHNSAGHVYKLDATITAKTLTDLKYRLPISVKDTAFGAAGDGQVVTDGVINSGQTQLTSATASFTASDVGKLIDINGAGTTACGQQYWAITGVMMNCNLIGTIAGYVNATTVTVSVPAGTSVTGAQVKWCTDDTSAIQAAVDALTASRTVGALYFPAGNYCVSRAVKKAFVHKTLYGTGKAQSNIWQMNALTYSPSTLYAAITVDNGSDGLTIRDLGFEGTNRYAELTTSGTTVADGILTCPGNAGSTLGGLCAAVNGMTNITLDNVRLDHFWGIGIQTFGGNATGNGDNIKILNSDASYNSADGFNPGVHDGLIMSHNTATYNGTGGIEATSVLNATIDHNYVAFNKTTGLSIGGTSNPSTLASVTIIGNTAYQNGNGSTSSTVGTGIVVTSNQQNCVVADNIAKQNHQIGISVQVTASATLTKHCLVRGNVATSNGITGASVSSHGISISASNVVVGGNKVYDEGLTGYSQRIGITIGSALDSVTIEPNDVGTHASNDYNLGTNLTNFRYHDPVIHTNMFVGSGTTLSGNPPARFFGTSAPGNISGNMPGDLYSDTTNHQIYQCNAVATATAPACTSITTGGWTLLNGAAPVATIMQSAAGISDVICAKGSDATVFLSGVLNAVTVTPGTDTSLPNSGTWTTTGGAGTGASGTFTASGGNLATVTMTNGGSGYTSNPTFVPNSGSIGTSTTAFSSCVNTSDGTSNTSFQLSWTQAAGYWSTGIVARVHFGFSMTTSGAPPNISLGILEDAGPLIFQTRTVSAPTANATNWGFSGDFTLVALATNSLEIDPAPASPAFPGGSFTSVANSTAQPASITFSGQRVLHPRVAWSANTAGNAIWLHNIVVQ